MTDPTITPATGAVSPTASTRWDADGVLVERTVDHGDGTATRTFYGPDGQPTGTETLTVPLPEPPAPPSAIDVLAAFPPEQATAMATLAVGIAADAGTLWGLLVAMNTENTARPILNLITHHALEAGLALQENT